MSLLGLPDELLLVVLAPLSTADVVAVMSVCKRLHRIGSDSWLWARLCRLDWDLPVSLLDDFVRFSMLFLF